MNTCEQKIHTAENERAPSFSKLAGWLAGYSSFYPTNSKMILKHPALTSIKNNYQLSLKF